MSQAAAYNTNLASEFFVLSCLHRRGIDACLTLGNKKSVDILAARPTGEALSIEVKAVAGKHDWFTGSATIYDRPRMYLVLVTFNGAIADTHAMPSVWVLPGHVAARHVKVYKGGVFGITRSTALSHFLPYEHAWDLLLTDTPPPGTDPVSPPSPLET